MTTILTTTGISLYINAKKEYQTDSPTDDQMRQYLRTKPERASSEAKSLLQIAKKDDHLIFLHTQTLEAKRCVHLLHDYFSAEGYQEPKVVSLVFQGDARHVETIGLRNLVNTFIDEIDNAQRKQQDVVINATAGFKAQVVYSTMIGMIYQVPVKYIYEDFQSVVTFNPISLDWDTSLFLSYNTFFKWLDAQPRTQSEVERYLKSLPERERIETLLTPPDADGEVFLSYMGEALRRKFERETQEANLALWPTPSEETNIEKKIASSLLEKKHHFSKNTLSTCYKIAAVDCVQEITGGNFENTTFSRVKRAYPDGSILLLWADGDKAVRLTVYTTAMGQPQTLKVAEKIKGILEIR